MKTYQHTARQIEFKQNVGSQQKTIQAFNIDAHWQIGWHWLAGNSFFPCGRIFISSFSEPLGINIEGLNGLLLGIQLFI